MNSLNAELEKIIKTYKEYNAENNDTDLLMDLYGITPEIKRENKQYWGRELGMLFELMCTEIFKTTKEFKPKEKIGNDAPYDFIYDSLAIDTKYRIGSGDAGTLKKFKQYAKELKDMGYTPVILLFRTDNLPAAITACINGGWKIYMGEDCFNFIKEKAKFDLKEYLKNNKGNFNIEHLKKTSLQHEAVVI